MIQLKTANKGRYISTGFICYKCLCVIDRKVSGKARKCKKCYKKVNV